MIYTEAPAKKHNSQRLEALITPELREKYLKRFNNFVSCHGELYTIENLTAASPSELLLLFAAKKEGIKLDKATA